MKRVNVFLRAWAIKKQYPQFTFRKALKIAWRAEKLVSNMRGGNVIEFVYVKSDGTIRIAKGTVNDTLAESIFRGLSEKERVCVTYFDVEKESYRRFRATQLVQIF